MSDDEGPPGGSDTYCERVRLLLSLHVDGEATPTQRSEIEEHLPGCPPCQAAQRVDLAVRQHMEAVGASLPAAALAEQVVRGALALQREARSVNRFLMASAAAAVLVALGAGLMSGSRGVTDDGGELVARAKDSTWLHLAEQTAPAIEEGK